MLLVTSGSGKLGTALKAVFAQGAFPGRAELDVLRQESAQSLIASYKPNVVNHAAAFTDVSAAELDKELSWNTNVSGTEVLG